jgi:hypothetical protein
MITYLISLTVLALFYGSVWHNRSAREPIHLDKETEHDEGLSAKRSSL